MITVKSDAFEHGGTIPKKHTGEGEDISPPLKWSGLPEDTREIAILCEDPDAPGDGPWVHWIVTCIPRERHTLPEANAGGGFEGINSWGRPGYGGPMPPPSHGPHHYHFRVFALDQGLSLGMGATKEELLEKMEGHVLDEGVLIGICERKG